MIRFDVVNYQKQILLNGGFEKHQRDSHYRMSRDIVVKNILSVENPIAYISGFDFDNIEPFTIVLIDWNHKLKTYELVWDGTQKYFQELSQEPKIWSASMLYDATMKSDRKEWFQEWLNNHSEYSQKEILAFHESMDRGIEGTALKMKRPFIETVSITSVKKENKLFLSYKDLKNSQVTELVL